jgi:hypothetical protein
MGLDEKGRKNGFRKLKLRTGKTTICGAQCELKLLLRSA